MADLEVDTRTAPPLRPRISLVLLLLAFWTAVAGASNRPGVLRGVAYVEQSD
ncbi:MAG: hypothetical protein JRF61_11540, partial [Deltaproteobacteria bacterium]|nr:hypothetical protein [Deltaproteobacteria bacterium]